MSIGALLLIILVVLLIGSTPQTGWHSYGWGPSGFLGILLIIVLVLLLLGRL